MSIRIGNKIIASTKPDIATPYIVGLVKPDNDTIKINEDGVISTESNDVIFRDWSK